MSVTEADSTTVNAVFTVSLSLTSALTVTVDYGTTDGTATAGSDYTAASGSLTFAPAQTSQTLTVAVSGDTIFEGNETFTVNLSNAAGATIADAQAIGPSPRTTAAPVLTIGDVSVTEGNSGTTPAVFTVSLTGTRSVNATVSYATARPGRHGRGDPGTDYTAPAGLDLPAGRHQ